MLNICWRTYARWRYSRSGGVWSLPRPCGGAQPHFHQPTLRQPAQFSVQGLQSHRIPQNIILYNPNVIIIVLLHYMYKAYYDLIYSVEIGYFSYAFLFTFREYFHANYIKSTVIGQLL